jgi:serine-type D-Ala-D-Ala endopeptidase (penicillin-binding protein 7)
VKDIVRSITRVSVTLIIAILLLSGPADSARSKQKSRHASLTKTANPPLDAARGKLPPKVNLRSVMVMDYDNGKVLYAKNADLVHPIASISKLVAAMVILDNKTDLSASQTISKDDAYQSSMSHLRPGWELTLHDLLYTSLMISDNRATRALSRAVSGTYDDFAAEMNKKVQELGLTNTVFYDPTGLDCRNVSTANELAVILQAAYKYNLIAEITSQKKYVVTFKYRKRTRTLQLANTNHLIGSQFQVLAGKTGYIQASAYCLVTLLQNDKGEKLAMILLGAPQGGLRFKEARKLATWGFQQIG